MMKMLESLVGRLTIWIGVSVLMLMVLQIVVDVVMRTFMGAGLPATSELVSSYYMVAVSFLPIAYSELRRRHVEATIFTDNLPSKWKLIIVLFGFLCSLLVYSLLFLGTYEEAMSHTHRGSYVESGRYLFYTWPSYWILPASFVMMALVMLFRVVITIGKFLTKHYDEQDNQADVLNTSIAKTED